MGGDESAHVEALATGTRLAVEALAVIRREAYLATSGPDTRTGIRRRTGRRRPSGRTAAERDSGDGDKQRAYQSRMSSHR